MHQPDAAKPATANGAPASNVEQLGGPLDTLHILAEIPAQLFGSDCAVVGDIKARNALDLCRELIAAGAHPDAALLCYRGDQVALRIRTIGEGAKLTIREDGLRVVAWRPFSHRDVSPPMRKNDAAALRPRGATA